MAELYQNNPETYHIDNSNGYSVPKYTGDKATDMQLNGLSDEDRKRYLEEANAPLTGEDVAKLVSRARETGYEPTAEEVQLYKQWAAKQNHSILQGIADGFAGVKNTFLNAGQEFIDHPFDTTIKLPTSVAEGFFQGGRNLYGMLAESQDPNSALFRFKSILTGDGSDPEAERRQFIEAMKFNHHTMDLEEGKDTLVLDKDIINHKVATAASFIADPTLLIPVVGEYTGLAKVASNGMRAIGLGERIAKITARSAEFQNKILGGALKWGVGTPVEFIGGAVRNTIDYGTMQSGKLVEAATGLPMSDWRATVRMSQLGTLGAEALGTSIPVAGDISKAHLAGTFGQGLGSAISAVGDQMIKQAEFGRGINSYAKQALLDAEKNGIVLTQHTKNMLRVLDAVDPLFSYSRVMTEGAIHGAAVGGTLGALSGGEEGFAQGIGAGIGLGMVGAGGARLYGDIGSGTHNSRVDIQSKLTMEGWKQTQPEKSFFWGLVKAHAEATGNAEYINKVNGYIAGIDKVCPDLQLHSFTDGKSFNSWLIENGYNPETRHFIETTALMEKAGLTREEKAKVMSVLRDNGNKFAGDSAAFQEHMAGSGKDLKYKSTYDSLSSNAKDALHQTIDNHAELIKQLKGEGDTIKDFYGDHAAADKFVDNINQFHKNSPTDAIRKAKEVLDAHRDENGNLTRRGEYLKDKLRAEGYTDAEGNVLPQRNMAVADLSGAEFNAAAGFVCRREQDGKVHMYLNLENVTRKTIPHEVFHAIFRESPMKKEFMSRWMRELLGSRDAQGNITQKPSVDIEQVRKFFHRYADIDPAVIDKQAKKDSINKAIEEHQKSGTNNTIADGTQSSLEKYAEEFGAYYFSHWLDSKPTDYLFHGGELTGMRGLMERVKDGWTGYWKEKMGNANPDFNFDNKGSLESQFEKKGKRIEVDAFDLFMRDFTRATANLNRGAFDPRSMSSRALGDFADSNGIYNVSSRDTQGRTIAINENQYNKLNAIAGKEIFKVLNGLDPKLRTTQTITIDGKQFIKGRFSQAELDAIVKSGHRNRAWADKHQQLYAVLDGKGSNVIDFGYLGRTAQIGDYSWPRLTGKQVPFKNRRAILLGMDSHIGQDGSFHTVFHTLDKAVIDARGNDVWKNPEARRLWNNDRAAMESDFFDYLANASLPKDHPDRKPSARLLEKMDGQGTPDGLGSQRRDWLHQMLGFAKDDRDVYINRPIAEIPFGIRHSVTSFNIDGATTFRVENGSRYNVNMDNAHNDLSRNFSPRDMEVEATPNGQIVKHKTGYRILENQRGNYNLISPTGEFISQHSTVADAGRSAQKHYDANFDKSVEGKDLPVPHTEIPPARQVYLERASKEAQAELFRDETVRQNMLDQLSEEYGRIDKSKMSEADKNKYIEVVEKMRRALEDKDFESKDFNDGFMYIISQPASNWSKLEFSGMGKDHFFNHFIKLNEHLRGKAGREYDNMYPMEIKSALHGRLSQIFQDYPNITAQGLLKKLETYGSTGYRYLQEAKDIGLVDLLKKKIQPRTEIYRKLDAQGNPTGEVVQRELPVKFKQLAVEVKGEDGKPVLDKDGYPVKKLVETNKAISGTQPKLDMQEILDFAKSKEIRVTIEEGAKELIGLNTSALTLGGSKMNYKETAIRINPEYAHGVRGHYGRDVIVHFRTTERLDVDGNRVLFVEEVQTNNTDRKAKSPQFNETLFNRTKIELEARKEILKNGIDSGMFVKNEDGELVNARHNAVNEHRTELNAIISDAVREEIPQSGYDAALDRNRQTVHIWDEIQDRLKRSTQTTEPDIIGSIDDVLQDEGDWATWQRIRNNQEFRKIVYKIEKLAAKEFRYRMDNSSIAARADLAHLEYYEPDLLKERIADHESKLSQLTQTSGKTPLTEKKDTSLTAIKGIIRQAIRDGLDTITLTHPDDSPRVSNMDVDSSRDDYGRIHPEIWRSWLKKYGIEISQQNRLVNPTIETEKNHLASCGRRVHADVTDMMSRFEQVMSGEDPNVINQVSKVLSYPVHEFWSFMNETHDPLVHIERLVEDGINDTILKNRIEKVIESKKLESAQYGVVKDIQSKTVSELNGGTKRTGTGDAVVDARISAEAVDRGFTFKLNDAIKRDFTEGRIQIYAQPAEEGASISGGRKYDLNSPEFRTGFIGRIAQQNQELTKDVNIQTISKEHGMTKIVLTDNSGGQSKNIGHISFDKFGGVSTNISPEYRGKGLSYLLYSEAFERMRAMGIKESMSFIVNKEAIPVKVREAIVGNTEWVKSGKRGGAGEPISQAQAKAIIDSQQAQGGEYAGVTVRNKIDPNAHYSPAEGRTYSEDEMKGSFVGRFAKENPAVTKGVSVKFTKDEESGLNGGETYRLNLSKKNGVVAFINIEKHGTEASVEYAKTDVLHRGKGYGNLAYSEMVERLRSLGVKEFSGMIVDEQGRPQRIRKKIIDQENERIGKKDSGTQTLAFRGDKEGYSQTDVVSYLHPEAHYSPAQKEDALIQNGFEKSELNKQLIDSGHIVLNFDERQLSGKAVVINNPDTMMTGELKTKEGKTLVEGEGGLNFVSKFADIWAKSKQSAAETTAKLLRKAQKENNGVAYLGLTRGDLTKPLTSHTGAKAGMAILEHFVDQGYISLDEFRNALKDSGRKYGIEFNATQSAKAIHAEIANKFFGVSDSTFEKRGYFVTDVIKHLAKNGESGHLNIQKIRDALGSERLGRKIGFAAKGIKEAIGLMISDKRANVDPSHIYAYIEVTGNISVENTENGHKSYPWHIVQRDDAGNKIRPRMLLPDKTNYVTDVMLDAKKKEVPRTYQVTSKKGKLQTKSGSGKLGSNQVGEAYGYVKPAEDIPEGKQRLAWQPAEGATDWKSERTTAGSILTNTAGYIISNINGKYKVYNPYKVMIGIYDNQEQAKKRVIREFSKQ